jgi:hypothetical protein
MQRRTSILKTLCFLLEVSVYHEKALHDHFATLQKHLLGTIRFAGFFSICKHVDGATAADHASNDGNVSGQNDL